MKKIIILFAIPLGILLSSCSTTKVVSDVNNTFEFDQIYSYTLNYNVEGKENVIEVNDLNKARVEQAIEKQMSMRGIQLVDEDADVVINYYVTIDTERSINTNGSLHGGSYGRWGSRYGGATGSKTATVETTTNGFLTIEMLDSSEDKMVWYAIAEKEIKSNNVKKAEENINAAVNKMMENLPSGQKLTAQK